MRTLILGTLSVFLRSCVFASVMSMLGPYLGLNCMCFTLSGVLDQPVNLAYDRPTPDKLLRAFKNLCRAVVARSLSERGDALLFKPATKTRDQLVGVGILGQNASLMFNVHASDAEALAIAQAIICLSRRVSAQNVNKFTNGQRCFIPRLLTLNGNSGWVSTVKRLSPQKQCEHPVVSSTTLCWDFAECCILQM